MRIGLFPPVFSPDINSIRLENFPVRVVDSLKQDLGQQILLLYNLD